ncbi:kinesin-like protein KIF18A isoform X2 [Ruditapes philippinarum]|uniref:kinesin-like protein KIF18A isoform X2 n=1 Tax=Ruditapes philippinarum TaxID=129788 RepID=UPI00295BA199|nr:kinesin-like protein KIF18A isoform X2 [Ruditapes philippinarum]
MPLPPTRKRPHGPDADLVVDDSGPSSNVKVVVRIRPPNVKETEGNFREVVQAVDENVLVFDPKEPSSYEYGGGRRRPRDIRQRRNKDLKFAFDHVFDASATNIDVYNETTNTVLTGLLNGYNCSVFAYGATGAGKTHTMLGSKDHPGVMYHTMMDLYSRIENMRDNKTCDVAVSYLEIYNETIRDLMMKGSVLPIREDPGKGVVVPGLSLHKPKTAEELLYMLQFGNQHRTQHPTDANAESSRSHAVLQVFVRQQDRTANISTEVHIAKLCLVDLAGSERATVTKNRGSRFREGANINRSLLALGNVINALAENKAKGYVPYRDSKLTRLLKDSLGGNCQTVMIAAVSPSAMSYEDTYNTLRYADRAKHIKATLKKNVINVDIHMAKYGKIVEELRKEIKELKGKLKGYEDIRMVPGEVVVQTDMSSFIGYQSEIEKFFVGHQSLHADQLQQEIALRNLQWKMYRKQRCLSRLNTVDEPCNIESLRKVETMLNGMKQKTSCMKISSESSRSKLLEGYKQLGDLEQDIKDSCGLQDNQLPEVLSLSLQLHGVKSELLDTKQYLSYTKQVVRCQEKELLHNERLVHLMLKLLKKQHYIMKGHNILTSDLSEDYASIQKRVAGQELCWGDEECGSIYTCGYTLADMLDLPSLRLKPDPNQQECIKERKERCSEPKKLGAVFEFTATQHEARDNQIPANYPFKVVDECSPPKAKRVMLPASQPPQSTSKVYRPGGGQSARGSYKTGLTPTKSRFTPSKSRSFTESSSSYNSVKNLTKNTGQNNSKVSRNLLGENKTNTSVSKKPNDRKRNLHRRSASVGSSVDFDTDESLELEAMPKSRFNKINDTMTKCKKFSSSHSKSSMSLVKSHTRRILIVEEESNHDGTFTIDPDCLDIPASVIPCVDCDSENNKSVKISVVSDSYKTCHKCAKEMNVNSYNNIKLDNGICDTRSTSLKTSHCGELNVEPAQRYTTCVEQLPVDYGPENDSGTSTIVDQSANSVTSLASLSTLVDGQNLSQNLSSSEDSNLHEQTICTKHKRDSLEMKHMESVDNKLVKVNSGTVTKTVTNTVQQETVTKSVNVGVSEGDREAKAVRCIKFDNIENNHTPTKGKSYADIVRTPTPERKPLRQVGGCNTILSSPRCDSRSFTSSDSDTSFDKRLSRESSSQLPGNSEEQKENFRILNHYGLPSLVSDSLLANNNKPSMKKNQSFTPGYMQSTKSHLIRKKHNTSRNSSDGDGLKVESSSSRVKTSFIAKHARPLSSHMRSKSTSNLSSRASWQI